MMTSEPLVKESIDLRAAQFKSSLKTLYAVGDVGIHRDHKLHGLGKRFALTCDAFTQLLQASHRVIVDFLGPVLGTRSLDSTFNHLIACPDRRCNYPYRVQIGSKSSAKRVARIWELALYFGKKAGGRPRIKPASVEHAQSTLCAHGTPKHKRKHAQILRCGYQPGKLSFDPLLFAHQHINSVLALYREPRGDSRDKGRSYGHGGGYDRPCKPCPSVSDTAQLAQIDDRQRPTWNDERENPDRKQKREGHPQRRLILSHPFKMPRVPTFVERVEA
jgi:hypothetical protein